MALPKSVIKVKKDHVEYISNVDRTKYTMVELERAALKDVGKLLRKRVKDKIPKGEGDAKKSIGTWVKKQEGDKAAKLLIGSYSKKASTKKNKKYVGFYFHILEFGSKLVAALRPLRGGVQENISTIRDIEAKYLSYIENEQKALSVINEEEEEADD